MKRILKKAACLLLTVGVSSSFADTGPLFTVTSNVPVGLISNAFAIATLQITTNVANKTYPSAGIKLVTPNLKLTYPGEQCFPNSSGYCLFSVSSSAPATISISSTVVANLSFGTPSTPPEIDMILCLSGAGEPLSCEKHVVSFPPI